MVDSAATYGKGFPWERIIFLQCFKILYNVSNFVESQALVPFPKNYNYLFYNGLLLEILTLKSHRLRPSMVIKFFHVVEF